ncbi:hypothetical protein FQA39_LY12368 [Lamprigera yunnana]|nr:hypothetical protein FQA39_LY12368 [Lamprigera yunnana]
MRLLIMVVFFHFGCSQKILPHLAAFWTNITLPHTEECIAESSMDPLAVVDLFHNVPVDDSRALRCFFKCLSAKLNMLLPNGEFDVHKYYKVAPDFEKHIIEGCVDGHLDETDICDKAFVIAFCIMQVAIE